MTVSRLAEKSNLLIAGYLERTKDRLFSCVEKANALSPLSILSRGYSIAETKNGIIKSTSEVDAGDEVRIILSDGAISATVTDIEKEIIKP